jgi:small subunit ribosomal protein S20
VANIKSQIKRNRQNAERRARNKSVRSFLKTKVKRFDEALAAGDEDGARRALRVASRELDKAAGKGIIHRNKAANKKSRLARRLTSAR